MNKHDKDNINDKESVHIKMLLNIFDKGEIRERSLRRIYQRHNGNMQEVISVLIRITKIPKDKFKRIKKEMKKNLSPSIITPPLDLKSDHRVSRGHRRSSAQSKNFLGSESAHRDGIFTSSTPAYSSSSPRQHNKPDDRFGNSNDAKQFVKSYSNELDASNLLTSSRIKSSNYYFQRLRQLNDCPRVGSNYNYEYEGSSTGDSYRDIEFTRKHYLSKSEDTFDESSNLEYGEPDDLTGCRFSGNYNTFNTLIKSQ